MPTPEASSGEYFQQEVNYRIQVTLNDTLHELNAFETVAYINHSPDTLRFLYFHLWPNGYSDNKTQLARQLFRWQGKVKLFNDPELSGYIDSLDFSVDGRPVTWNLLPGLPDVCRIDLNDPVVNGDTVYITTPFRVKIPSGVSSRLGHSGESYQISQWYPKPAVYDRTGWHKMPYLDQGEFYSEFGRFDVSITLPENYIVGATGNLQNEREKEFLDSLATDHSWKRTANRKDMSFPPSSNRMKTLRYTEDNIHDFAWFADKRFHVLKGKVILPDSGREVTTWVMYTDMEAELWKDAIPYVDSAIFLFSKWNGDYPYHSFTAVQGALTSGIGMEYPGLTVIGLAGDGYSLDRVIAHEAGHSWFYSALGSDERRYPFMDEGITSAYEVRYLNERYPEPELWNGFLKNRKLAAFFHTDNIQIRQLDELGWLVEARKNNEQSLNLAAPDYTISNYDLMIYYKAARGFNYLRAYIGDSLFDSAMHDYYSTWKFKHPQPQDLRDIFESHTGKNLDWFFSDFIGTAKRIDYHVIALKNNQLLVRNSGELESPLVLSGMIGDSICFEKWADGFSGQKWIDIPPGNYTAVKIDPDHIMPELNRLNNNIRTSGIFPKSDPFQTQLLFSIENPDKRSLMYFPTVNWNKENGLMAGVIVHNGFLLPKPVEYLVMPFFSFKKTSLAGFGRISFNIAPYAKYIRLMKITLEGTQFGAPGNQNYRRAKAGLDLYFRNSNMANLINQKVFGYYTAASDLLQIELREKAKMSSFLHLGYQLEKTGLVNPFGLLLSVELNKSYQKASVEFKYKYSYSGKHNGLDIRLFAGTMLRNMSKVPFYALAASGRSGPEEYLYQGTFPDRFGVFPTTFWSRQMTLSEGSLVTPVNSWFGYSRRLISASISFSLPGKASRIPIKPFVNILWSDRGVIPNQSSPLFCEAGLKAGIWNIFEIFVPLMVSKNIGFISGPLKDRIRFVLNLQTLSQIKLKAGH